VNTSARFPAISAAAFGSALSLVATVAAGADLSATAAAAAATSTSPLIAPPVTGGLTADEAAARAARTSPDVRSHAEETAQAMASLDQTRAAFIPRLSGAARYTRYSSVSQPSLGNLVVAPAGTPAGPVTSNTPLAVAPISFPVILDQYAGQATLQIPVSDYAVRLPHLRSAAEKNARASKLLEQATLLKVAADARIAYYGWARARLQIGVAERSLSQAQAHLKDVQAAFTSGAASKADVLQVEAQVASAELGLTQTLTNSQIQETRLRVMTHDPSATTYEIGEDLRDGRATPTGTFLVRDAHQGLLDEALRRRFEPRALGESAAALRDQAVATRAAELPRLDATANAVYARPSSRIFPQKDEFRGSWDAGLVISWSPTDILGTEAGRSGQLAHARQLTAELDQLGDDISVEIDQAVQALRQAETAIRTSDRGLASAEESYRVRRSLFQNGRATSVELTDAETSLARAQLDVIGAVLDRRVADVRFVHAVGRDAPL
jgi:outer membrane protein TolC